MLPYEWHGSGPPLLLLAGLGAKGTSFHPFLDVAADRYRVLTPDLRGSGRAGPLVPGTTLRDMAADVAELLEALDLGPLPVVGRSMGGMIAQELALLAPEQIDVMVLASSTAHADPHLGEIFRLLADMSRADIPAELRHRTSLLWALGPSALAERESVRAYLDARVRNDRPRDYAIQALACAAHDTRARLARAARARPESHPGTRRQRGSLHADTPCAHAGTSPAARGATLHTGRRSPRVS